MKKRSAPLIFQLFFVIAFASGCIQSEDAVSAQLSAVPSAIINTATLTQTDVPANTSLPLPSSTPMISQALSDGDAGLRLLNLLANNGGCQMPCIWGITPGMSTYKDAQNILMPLSSISDLTGFPPEGGSIAPKYIESNRLLTVNIGFNVDSLADTHVVSRIGLLAREFKIVKSNDITIWEPIFDFNTFGKQLYPYMLPNILTEQGMPAAVLISTDSGKERGENVPGFYILLIYPDQGILVSYTTYRKVDNGNVIGCPSNAHVEIELSPSGNSNIFIKNLNQTKWANLWPIDLENAYWKPIESVTAMTLSQFYETFHSPTDKCIETPLNLWPKPDN